MLLNELRTLRGNPGSVRSQSQIVSRVSSFGLFAVLLLVAVEPCIAQKEIVLHRFTCAKTDGCFPQAGLVLDGAGNLYGTTSGGGPGSNSGNVFKLTPSGQFSVLYTFGSFNYDGATPTAGLILDSKGNLYGTTTEGGTGGCGTVFEISPSGSETLLHDFSSSIDGCYPQAGVVMDNNGNLYGATLFGGASAGAGGTVFKLNISSQTLTTLHSFTCGVDGCEPLGVVLDKNGNLYGATSGGGAANLGVVFKVTQSGTETVLHRFTAGKGEGFYPSASVILDQEGNVYGTTVRGGAIGLGIVFKISLDKETILHSFAGGTDGIYPESNLVFDTNGNLYGTSFVGGTFDFGAVFKLSPTGVETTLHSFAPNGSDGVYPEAGLAFDKAGNIYGTTNNGGGTCNCGTIYKIVP